MNKLLKAIDCFDCFKLGPNGNQYKHVEKITCLDSFLSKNNGNREIVSHPTVNITSIYSHDDNVPIEIMLSESDEIQSILTCVSLNHLGDGDDNTINTSTALSSLHISTDQTLITRIEF
mmetsp:Transcript_22268/g.21411  ORF Transcript_22268/g.21411 Transcript_22268/m.21411 type:complete len:119 (-) Transcript_22268:388-744(-)